MFIHKHPYPPFIPEKATRLIVGTLPPPRFSRNALVEDDIDFCYGSHGGMLWRVLDRVFETGLSFDNTQEAVEQRKQFLIENKIGICDMVASCERDKVNASDLGIKNPTLRPMLKILREHPLVDTLLFTGGNSKNGPEYFFRKHIKGTSVKMKLVNAETPRIHEFHHAGRTIRSVSLTAPSGAANRAIGSMDLYKKLKDKNPEFNTMDFRVIQYKPFFLNS